MSRSGAPSTSDDYAKEAAASDLPASAWRVDLSKSAWQRPRTHWPVPGRRRVGLSSEALVAGDTMCEGARIVAWFEPTADRIGRQQTTSTKMPAVESGSSEVGGLLSYATLVGWAALAGSAMTLIVLWVCDVLVVSPLASTAVTLSALAATVARVGALHRRARGS